jgi:hypothetical protein
VKNAIFLQIFGLKTEKTRSKSLQGTPNLVQEQKAYKMTKNDLPKYGQYGEKSLLSSVYGGFKILSFFAIPLLVAQNLR